VIYCLCAGYSSISFGVRRLGDEANATWWTHEADRTGGDSAELGILHYSDYEDMDSDY